MCTYSTHTYILNDDNINFIHPTINRRYKKKFPDDNNKIELTIPDETHNAGFLYNPKITYACECVCV